MCLTSLCGIESAHSILRWLVYAFTRTTPFVLPRPNQLARLERLVAKQEELLHDYRPPKHVEPLHPELKRKVQTERLHNCC